MTLRKGIIKYLLFLLKSQNAHLTVKLSCFGGKNEILINYKFMNKAVMFILKMDTRVSTAMLHNLRGKNLVSC